MKELKDKIPQANSSEAKEGEKSIGVGAAFALTYGNSTVVSQVGTRKSESNVKYKGVKIIEAARGDVTAGTISITASSEHEEENFSTAGTDPIEGTSVGQKDGAGEKDIGVDASVAINILDNDIYAAVAEGTKVKTTAVPGVDDPDRNAGKKEQQEEEETEEDEPEDIEIHNGAVIVSATEVSANETKSSAYATGSTTSVGVSVAVNVSLSDIEAKLGSGADASGSVTVRSHSLSRDNTWSFASAMGADMQRKLNNIVEKEEKLEEICKAPKTGRSVYNPYLKRDDIQRVLVKNYIAYYLVDEEEEQIVVLRVVYSRRDRSGSSYQIELFCAQAFYIFLLSIRKCIVYQQDRFSYC